MSTGLCPLRALVSGGPASVSALRALAGTFREVVDTPGFPCLFAQLPFTTGDIFFGAVPAGAGQLDRVVDLLVDLAETTKAAPDALAVVFVEDELPVTTLDDDFALATAIVQRVMMRNQQANPQCHDVPSDDPAWTLWLNGVGLFLNFSSPRHLARRSRNVGPCFTVIAQSRASFDQHPRSSSRLREEIRRRVAQYDRVPVHPSLGRYGDPASREALQFFLGDDTVPMDPTTGTVG